MQSMAFPDRLEFCPRLKLPPPEVVQLEALAESGETVDKAPGILNPFSDIISPPAVEGDKIIPQAPVLPEDIFSRSPEKGAFILQKYLDALPESERYAAFEPLVRKHWKWLCKAAPYLKFPEPKPIFGGLPINIGIRIWGLTGGGTERVMQVLANHFGKDPRYHVTIFIDARQARRIDYPLHENVTIVGVAPGERTDWKEVIEKYPQDVVICPEYHSARNAQNILLLKFLGVRVFAQEHNPPFYSHPFTTSDEKFSHFPSLYSACDAMSCLSQADAYKWKKEGMRNSIYLPNPPTFDPNSVSPSTLEPHSILWVGSLVPWQKRPEMAIEVFAKVLQKVPTARLIMVGAIHDRRCHRRCLQRIHELGIGHAVDIVGFQKDMAPIYSNGALLMSTSRFEGWGMMIIEAKTFGLPVVSTAMPYLETLNGGCIQTPPNDVDALAEAVVDLLENPEKRKQLGAEARRDVVENFSNEVVFAKYEALIEAILTGSDAVAKFCAGEPLMDAETAEQMLAVEAKALK
ncbi:MAG: glycosyltransferase [Puniceicoccales bacterium]|nr:glycosyltransferase [Puniceicoccales bacterium]